MIKNTDITFSGGPVMLGIISGKYCKGKALTFSKTFYRREAGEGEDKEESYQELNVEPNLHPLPLLEDEALQQRMIDQLVSFAWIQLDV